jgi:nucleoside-diphosphate-sugar epimerase
MRVFVTGGTGAIGGHAVPALVAAGHAVSALARSADKAARLRARGAEPALVSLFDRRALTDAFAGHDAVCNLATAIPPMNEAMDMGAWAANDRVRVEGSAAVVDAALAAGVPRVVQESISFLYPDSGSAWIDEDVPLDPFPLARSTLAAEANARRFSEAGGTGVVLRFGWFYGPGATHSEQLLGLARRHLVVQMGRPDDFVSSIHMDDAGAAVVAALHAPAGVFNVVDDEPLTKRAYGDALAAAAGTTPWLRLPGRAALLFGDRAASLTRSQRVRNARFRAATGWAPRHPNAREGWMATARALASDPPRVATLSTAR